MIQLIEPTLGTLQLRDDPFTVVSFQIGSPAPRVVARHRALADGMDDDTRFAGARAVTLALRLNESNECATPGTTMQDLLDRLLPYMAVRRRPVFRWSLPGSGGVERELIVRGESAPVVIQGRRKQAIVCSFIASDGEITSPDQECVLIAPTDNTEAGRQYNLTFDRDYPTSTPAGEVLVTQNGNEAAHWTATIFGDVTGPSLVVNGSTITWPVDYNVPAGATIVIDTKTKSMLLNGVAADSVYGLTNFTEWQWSDLMLEPGANAVRYYAETLGTGTVMQMCWRPTWAG